MVSSKSIQKRAWAHSSQDRVQDNLCSPADLFAQQIIVFYVRIGRGVFLDLVVAPVWRVPRLPVGHGRQDQRGWLRFVVVLVQLPADAKKERKTF